MTQEGRAGVAGSSGSLPVLSRACEKYCLPLKGSSTPWQESQAWSRLVLSRCLPKTTGSLRVCTSLLRCKGHSTLSLTFVSFHQVSDT